jgi:ATP-dependent exoDNAse (exonuclease V) beta subunit
MFSRLFPRLPHDPNVFRPAYEGIEAARPAARRELDARITLLQAAHEERADRHFAEAEAIADWIEAKRERGGGDLRRFAVLFRRMSKLDDYLDVFQRRGIDYVLPPTPLFLDRPAAVDLVAVLRAVAWPFDRGAQISAARTPYFALTDREIVEGIAIDLASPLSPRDGDEGRVRGESTHEPTPWQEFQTAMEGYREASRHRTVSGLAELVVATCGIEEVYRAAADGTRSLRHLEHLRSIAFDFDLRSGGSVRQFVDEIQNRRREPEEMEPVLADETQNAVRILSVHAAKGLEFETVILPDLAFGPGSTESTQLFTAPPPGTRS